ncbi:MAG: McrB family protein [Bacillota bacterium]
MLTDFIDFVKLKGFNFDVDILKTYILALKTKPFVLLTGISGTGKTRIAQFFAEYMTSGSMTAQEEIKISAPKDGSDDFGKTKANNISRYCFVSVRPDWSDNKGLLGFYNANTESYEETELLKLMLRAEKDISNPYFVIFDEMNLAKVEHYFSDFLSCMESKTINKNGEISSEPLILHYEKKEIPIIDEHGESYLIPPKLIIPENIYFTGTVNIDKSSYMFSPKVLDRANVIEFNKVDLESYTDVLKRDSESRKKLLTASPDFINLFTDNGNYNKKLIAKDFELDEDIQGCINHLININEILKEYNLHFGYRVVDEMLLFICHSKKMGYYDPLTALDYQILQRILPKFHGNKKKIEIPFSKLLRYFFGFESSHRNFALTNSDYEYIHQYFYKNKMIGIPTEFYSRECHFRNSGAKVFKMLVKLAEEDYISFIE